MKREQRLLEQDMKKLKSSRAVKGSLTRVQQTIQNRRQKLGEILISMKFDHELIAKTAKKLKVLNKKVIRAQAEVQEIEKFLDMSAKEFRREMSKLKHTSTSQSKLEKQSRLDRAQLFEILTRLDRMEERSRRRRPKRKARRKS